MLSDATQYMTSDAPTSDTVPNDQYKGSEENRDMSTKWAVTKSLCPYCCRFHRTRNCDRDRRIALDYQ